MRIMSELNSELSQSESMQCEVKLLLSEVQCCIKDCPTNSNNNDSSQVSFISFPKDPSRRNEWLQAIKSQDNFSSSKSMKRLICVRHFPSHAWVNQNARMARLHKNSIPEVKVIQRERVSSPPIVVDDLPKISLDPPDITPTPNPVRGPGRPRLHPIEAKVSLQSRSKALIMRGPGRPRLHPKEAKASLQSRRDALIMKGPGRPRLHPNETKTKAFLQARNNALIKKVSSRVLQSAEAKAALKSRQNAILENQKLKLELEKAKNNIINQKSHFENLIWKQKMKTRNLESKLKEVKMKQHKVFKAYDSKIDADKTVAQIKSSQLFETASYLKVALEERESQLEEVKQKILELSEENNMLKAFKKSKDIPIANLGDGKIKLDNDSPSTDSSLMELERELAAANKRIEALTTSKKELEEKNQNLLQTMVPELSKTFYNFEVEKFRLTLKMRLAKEDKLKKKVKYLSEALEQQESAGCLKSLVLNISGDILNPNQMAVLTAMLKPKDVKEEVVQRQNELFLAIFETSPDAYKLLAKYLDLPPSTILEWRKRTSIYGLNTINCSLKAFNEKLTPIMSSKSQENTSVIGEDNLSNMEPSSHETTNGEDVEEGKVSNVDELSLSSDSEDESLTETDAT